MPPRMTYPNHILTELQESSARNNFREAKDLRKVASRMVLALAAASYAGFVSPMMPSRVVAAASRGPATFSMQVKGLGSDTDRRPVEMIHADADKAFKFLDTENVGNIDNEKLRSYLNERDYDAELVDKIFAGIDAAKDGVIDADVLPACGKRRHATATWTHGPQ